MDRDAGALGNTFEDQALGLPKLEPVTYLDDGVLFGHEGHRGATDSRVQVDFTRGLPDDCRVLDERAGGGRHGALDRTDQARTDLRRRPRTGWKVRFSGFRFA